MDPVKIKKEGDNFTVNVTLEGFPQPIVTARLFSLDSNSCMIFIFSKTASLDGLAKIFNG